ncbi:MAG: flavodoxin [Bacteroidales bacterium]|nr:flavodoxin [Bacteroidales bacterium]
MIATAAITIGSCSVPEVVPSLNEKKQEETKEEESKPDSGPETSEGKTLVIYYSYTGNTREIVADLKKQISCDVVEVIPEGKYDYNANNYKIGADQINAINANPDKESSYPAIKETKIDMEQYGTIIIATPLWHARMASNTQTLLFQYGKQMSGKKIGLIVSSHSSGISGVESDAKRLVPEGKFTKSLWINANNHSSRASLVSKWLSENGIK